MRSRRYDVPPLDPLLAFEAVARNLSFTKAASELFLTQSAVSRQVQQLEEHLGVKLFERRARSLAPTEAGARLARTVQQALDALHECSRALRDASTQATVTVTTTPGFAALWLIPRLGDFTREHPQVDVRLAADSAVVDIDHAGVDLAVRYLPNGGARGATLLFGESVTPVCSPALLRARPLRVPEDLQGHVLLHLHDRHRPWLDWDPWLHAVGLTTDFGAAGHLRFNHYDQLIQAALAGQGVALGRQPLVRGLLRERKLVAPFTARVASSGGYYLIEAAAARGQPQVGTFARWLIAASAAEAGETPTG